MRCVVNAARGIDLSGEKGGVMHLKTLNKIFHLKFDSLQNELKERNPNHQISGKAMKLLRIFN